MGLEAKDIARHPQDVDFARRIVALLLVAFWLPASSHVHLQHFGLIHEIHEDHHHHDQGDAPPGHHEHGADNHAAADGQCILTCGGPALDLPGFVFVVVGLDFDWDAMVLAAPSLLDSSGLAPPCTGPPEIPRSWQFLLRAALPVRAPSFVS